MTTMEDSGLINQSSRPIKRRKVLHSGQSTPRSSSPDELGINRSTSIHRANSHVPRRSPSQHHSSRGHSVDSDVQSPDELAPSYDGLEAGEDITPRRNRSSTPRTGSSYSHSPSPEPKPEFLSRESTVSPRRAAESVDQVDIDFQPVALLHGHGRAVTQAKFSPDGEWLATCSADSTIKLWNARSGRHLHTLRGHLAGVSVISWSPDSTIVASGSDDKTIRLWRRVDGVPIASVLKGHQNYVYSLAFSPHGNMLVSGSYDEAVFLWDVGTGRLMRSLPAHSDPVAAVDFVRDGTLVVSCGHDGLVRIWDATTGQCLRTLVHEDNVSVTNVQFSPSGRHVLAWTRDSCIRLWDYVEGRCIKTYTGHTNVLQSMGGGFFVAGRETFIVSASEDGNVLVWEVTKKTVRQCVRAHDSAVAWVDVHPSGERMASVGHDGLVKLWVNRKVEQTKKSSVGVTIDVEMKEEEEGLGFDSIRSESSSPKHDNDDMDLN